MATIYDDLDKYISKNQEDLDKKTIYSTIDYHLRYLNSDKIINRRVIGLRLINFRRIFYSIKCNDDYMEEIGKKICFNCGSYRINDCAEKFDVISGLKLIKMDNKGILSISGPIKKSKKYIIIKCFHCKHKRAVIMNIKKMVQNKQQSVKKILTSNIPIMKSIINIKTNKSTSNSSEKMFHLKTKTRKTELFDFLQNL